MNEACVCKRCGGETPHLWADYCDRCERWFERQDDLDGDRFEDREASDA